MTKKSNTSIDKAREIVKEGGVIVHLTDTIWGLACDPKNQEAIQKLHSIKKRPDHKSYIILISEEAQLYNYVKKIPEIAWDIIELADEPLTVIYPEAKNLPDIVTGEDGSIGIRLVKDSPCAELLKRLKNGLISTSANLSGEASPTSFSEISNSVLNAVDYIVSSTDDEIKNPSKIIKLGLDGTFQLIRK